MIKQPAKPPALGFLFKHPAHLVACGFGSGLSPVAPGTVGTLFAWAVFLLLDLWFDKEQLLGLFALCFVIGIYAVDKTGRDLQATDHGSLVWDEIVPFWLVLWYCPEHWLWQAVAFFLFRFFDIVKPQPARFFDQQVKNGFGVMMDDLVAAAYSILVLVLLQLIF